MCKSFPVFFLSLLQVVLWLNFGTAQNIFRGEITDVNEQYLPFSNISWYGTEIFTQADEKGAFAIPFPPDTVHLPFRLIATYAGLRDTFEFDDLYSFWTFIPCVYLSQRATYLWPARSYQHLIIMIFC